VNVTRVTRIVPETTVAVAVTGTLPVNVAPGEGCVRQTWTAYVLPFVVVHGGAAALTGTGPAGSKTRRISREKT
jgi:hypothetical protein